MNNSKTKGRGKPKTLNCKECGDAVHNCGATSVSVTCFVCVNKSMSVSVNETENE